MRRLQWIVCGLVVAIGACGDEGVKTGDTTSATGLDTSPGDGTETTDTSTPSETSAETTEPDTSAPTDSLEPDSDVEPDVEPETEDAAPDDADTSDTSSEPSGERCDDPFVVTLPTPFDSAVTVTGDTTGAGDDHDVVEGACAGVQWALGDGAPDDVWSFTAPSAGSYAITLRAETADLAFYVLAGCAAASNGDCVRGADTIGQGSEAPDSANVVIGANQTVSVVVDSFADASTPASFGAYELVFEPRRSPTLGDECGSAITLQPGPGGYVGSGDNGPTSTLNDDYNALACSAEFDGFGVQEQVWKFMAPSAGNWDVTVTPSAEADPMIYFHAEPSCGDTCTDFVDDLGDGGVERTTLALTANEVVFIVVDAFQVEAGGQYVLKVAPGCVPNACAAGSCADDGCGVRCPCAEGEECDLESNQCECVPNCVEGACGMSDGCDGTCGCGTDEACVAGACELIIPGESCDDTRALGAGPSGSFVGSGDLGARTHDESTGTCTTLAGSPPSGATTPDEVWSFVVPSAGRYRVTVDPTNADMDPYFTLHSGASCGVCLGAVDSALAGGDDIIEVELAAGPHTLVVDTESIAGPYSVSIVPVGDTPGDGCPLPLTLTLSGGIWSGAGDLSLVDVDDDDEFEVGTCAQIGTSPFRPDGIDTEDQVFAFDPPTGGNWRITVTPTDGDVFVQVLAGAECASASCLGYTDEAGYNVAEVVTLNLTAGTHHWIVVDTYLTGEAGAYTVTAESICTPQCSAGSCADNGCGTPCACSAGQICGANDACEAVVGNDCSAPHALTDGPSGSLVGGGDLSGESITDDFDQLACNDLGDSFDADGVDTADEVFAFTVPADGAYRITVTPGEPDFDLVWALQSGATCATSSCLGYVDESESTGESAELTLSAAQQYWLVVDSSALTNPADYTVAVEPIVAGTPGETCESPLLLEVGVATSGTTLGAVDDLDGLQCTGAGTGGVGHGDIVYRLDSPAAGQFTFTLTPAGGADLALFAFSPATGTCNAFACIDGSDVGAADAVETIDVTMNQGSAVYVVVDGESVDGAYTLTTSTTAQRCATDLFISEYIEGSGNNKGLEIYNGTGAEVDLTRYAVRVQQNGSSLGSYRTEPLTGTLAAGATYTLCNSSFTGQDCDYENSAHVVQFNGNDSVALLKDAVVIDIIGVDGENPGTSWPIGDGSTIDHTLRRKPSITSPSASWNTAEWLVLDNGVFDGFDAHSYAWQCTQ